MTDERLPKVGSGVQVVTAVTDARGVLIAVVEGEDDIASLTASLPDGGETKPVPYIVAGSTPVVASAYSLVVTVEGNEVRSTSRLIHGLLTSSDGRPVVSAVTPLSVDGTQTGVIVEIQGTDILWCDDVVARLKSDISEGKLELLHEWMTKFGLEVPERQDDAVEDGEPAEGP